MNFFFVSFSFWIHLWPFIRYYYYYGNMQNTRILWIKTTTTAIQGEYKMKYSNNRKKNSKRVQCLCVCVCCKHCGGQIVVVFFPINMMDFDSDFLFSNWLDIFFCLFVCSKWLYLGILCACVCIDHLTSIIIDWKHFHQQ